MKRHLSNALLAAALLWFVMFSPWTAGNVNFWGVMSSAAALLLLLSLWYGRDLWKERWQQMPKSPAYILQQIVLGVGIAAVLWGVFWIGDKVSQWLFPSFARMEVDAVYGLKKSANQQLIGWLLLLLIGPAEEIFWRGYVQAAFYELFKANRPQWLQRLPAQWAAMLVATAIYALIHIPAANFMLVMAALVCGVVWGGLYAFRRDWLPAVILSHALWDAAVFVWFPIM
jgi:membrane protease YdiL (CAAX protease family)